MVADSVGGMTSTIPNGPGAPATPVGFQVVIDCADPHAQARFWAAAIGYEVEDHDATIRGLLEGGRVPAALTLEVDGVMNWKDAVAIRRAGADEEEALRPGGRVLFVRVPEPKTVKNRVHLDLHPPAGTRDAEVERLTGLGARVLYEHDEMDGRWVTLADPEGNEFCIA